MNFSGIILCVSVASFSNFYPLPVDDPSFRADKNIVKMHDPIVMKGTFDCFRVGSFEEQSCTDWKSFMFSRSRIIHISSCGRPLWGYRFAKVQYEAFEREAEEEGMSLDTYLSGAGQCSFSDTTLAVAFKKLGALVKISADQVTHGHNFSFETLVKDNEAVAVLALSVALQSLPANVDIAELVRVGPFNILDVNTEERTLTAMACSEGVFNGTASLMLLRHLYQVGAWMLKWIGSVDRCMMSPGEAGELIDRVSMIQALELAGRTEYFEESNTDSIAPKKFHTEFIFEPIGLRSFLIAYVNDVKAVDEYLAMNPGLVGAFVAFSHFVYMGKDWVKHNPYDVAANAFSRGAAIVPRKGSHGLDAMIPLVLANGKMSFIYIQTKMGSSYTSPPSVEDILRSSPSKKLSVRKDGDEERPYCYLFRHYNTNQTYICSAVQVVEKITDPPNTINHQPCLSICGPVNSSMPPQCQMIADFFCLSRGFEFLELNASMKNVWTDPKKLSRSAFEHAPMGDRFKMEEDSGPVAPFVGHNKREPLEDYEELSKRVRQQD